jgi:hypothetical protein
MCRTARTRPYVCGAGAESPRSGALRGAAEMARRARRRTALAHEPPLALVARVAPPARLEHFPLGAGAARAHAQASAIPTRRTHEPARRTVPVHAILVLPADAAASGAAAQAVSCRSLSFPRSHLTGPPVPIHTSFTYPETTVARGLAAMKRRQPLPPDGVGHWRRICRITWPPRTGRDWEAGRRSDSCHGWRVSGRAEGGDGRGCPTGWQSAPQGGARRRSCEVVRRRKPCQFAWGMIRVRPNASRRPSSGPPTRSRSESAGLAASRRPPESAPGWGSPRRGKRKIPRPNRYSRRVLDRGEDPVACSHA